MQGWIAALMMVGLAWVAAAGGAEGSKNPVVLMSTSMGEITIELNQEKAPVTVKNFLDYVESKHYDGTIFHRVIKGFMIQGGGLDESMKQRPTKPPIKNEAGNGLKNTKGTIAMARTNVVDSATAQFFINTVDNGNLDHKNETPTGFGYAVFGRVIKGLDVVEKIEKVATTSRDGHQNVPVEPVVIKSVTLAK
jgi:peptidyl-prolyl cis-trans isomerase A (cyclophilin A)